MTDQANSSTIQREQVVTYGATPSNEPVSWPPAPEEDADLLTARATAAIRHLIAILRASKPQPPEASQ